MTRSTIRTKMAWIVFGAAASCIAADGMAWDEDTGDPNAGFATPSPLQGTDPDIDFDHAVIHWEMAYFMARCIGIPDDLNEGPGFSAASWTWPAGYAGGSGGVIWGNFKGGVSGSKHPRPA